MNESSSADIFDAIKRAFHQFPLICALVQAWHAVHVMYYRWYARKNQISRPFLKGMASMSTVTEFPRLSSIHWTKEGISFQVLVGTCYVPCIISVSVLEEKAGRRFSTPADALISFRMRRDVIATAARKKTQGWALHTSKSVRLQASDFDDYLCDKGEEVCAASVSPSAGSSKVYGGAGHSCVQGHEQLPRLADPIIAPDPPSLRFEVRHHERRIACLVLNEALEAAAGLELPTTGGQRRKSFDRFRVTIDSAAKLKLGNMPDSFAGLVMISSDDMRRVPSGNGLPLFGSMFANHAA